MSKQLNTFDAKQYRAIGWYAKEKGLRLALTTYPRVTLMNDRGEEVVVDINSVVKSYEAGLKQQAKERARERRLEKKRMERLEI